MSVDVSRETSPRAAPTAIGTRHAVSRETEAATSSPGPSYPRRNPLARGAVAVLLLPLRAYRRLLSPALPPRCRYYPTCSSYAEQALRELGPVKGTIVAVWRVLRCNPLSSGGLDPLESRRLFRSDEPDEASPPAARTV